MAEFGYHTIGGSANADGGNFVEVSKETLSEAGDVTKLTVYVDGGTTGVDIIRGCIYADSSGTPGAKLGSGTDTTIADGAAAAWLDLPFASPISLTAGTYWIGFHFGGNAAFNHYYDTSVGNLKYVSRAIGSGEQDPFGVPGGTLDQRVSIYATYTPSAASVTGSSSLQLTFGASSSGRGPVAADVVEILTGLVDDQEIVANERAADFGDYVGIPSLPGGIPTRPKVKIGTSRSIVDGFSV